MIAEIMAKFAICSETLTSREPKSADGIASLVCWSNRTRHFGSHRFTNEDGILCFRNLGLRSRGITVLAVHECHDSSTQVICMNSKSSLDLLIGLRWAKYRSQHIVGAHVRLLRLNVFGCCRIQPAMPTRRGCSTSTLVVDQPVHIIATKVTIYISCRASIGWKLVCI